jgi:hypothetical protein
VKPKFPTSAGRKCRNRASAISDARGGREKASPRLIHWSTCNDTHGPVPLLEYLSGGAWGGLIRGATSQI